MVKLPLWKERRQLAQLFFAAGLCCLLVLSEVFSSNIQATLPAFSRAARLCLTASAVLLLLCKSFLLTEYPLRWQPGAAVACLAAAGLWALYGGDRWFFLAVLVGVAAKDVDLRRMVRLYLFVAALCLLFIQLLHFTGLVPYNWYCRNWDFGYGHYNGYGARLTGVFFAWGWLRFEWMRWWDWAGLCGLLAYTWAVPHCRGAAGGMAILLLFCLGYRGYHLLRRRGLPAISKGLCRLLHGAVLALLPLLTLGSLFAGYFFDPARPDDTPLLKRVDRILSGRFEIWHNVFWQTPASLFGGVPTDGDEHHAIDNAYLALWMNKGVLGAVLVYALLLALLWRLCRGGHTVELLCLCAYFFYCLMENRLFLLSADPMILLLPCVLFWPPQDKLPVLSQKPL